MTCFNKKTIYISIIILLLLLIYIKKRSNKYGYKNIETFIDLDEKNEADDEYVKIIKENTEKLKKRLNNLHQYYIYKLLETVFLKKTEINILSLLVKNKKKCNNNCMLQTKRVIVFLQNQVGKLEKIINDF